jgi:hypothetical protein
MDDPSLNAALRALTDRQLLALASERGASLRAAALDVVAAALGLLRALTAEEAAQVVKAAQLEVKRRRRE